MLYVAFSHGPCLFSGDDHAGLLRVTMMGAGRLLACNLPGWVLGSDMLGSCHAVGK